MDPHDHNSTHHRIIIHTPMTHSNTHIHYPNQKQMHIPSSAPPIRDSTPSRWSGNHPNHQGTTYTIPITVTQSQTQTHVPKETRTSAHCGRTHQDQAEHWVELNHSFPIQYASLNNIESFSLFSPHPWLTLHTYAQSHAPTVILPTVTGFYWPTHRTHWWMHRQT